VITQSVAAFDASGDWRADGARSASQWLSVTCKLPSSTTNRLVHLARMLRHMPLVEQAWLAGEINNHHVAALCKAYRPTTTEAFARDEAMLVDQAKTMRFGHFLVAVRYWLYKADPDRDEDEAQQQHDARSFYLDPSGWGKWFGKVTLDSIGGTIVHNEMKRIERQLFEADWAEAKARLGDDVCATDLRRTPAQRRADALVEMATRSAAMPAGARRPEPLFSVYVGFETLHGPICELANGQVVTPGSLVPWLDQAWLERVVFDPKSRPIDVGEQRRLFTGATRRAVELRDRECYHVMCDVRAEDAEIDHVIPASVGGPTIQDNGRVACGFHNRLRLRREPEPPVP
jgi:GNAT superfamily N-acetyltransferase